MIASLALVGCSTQRLAASLVADPLAAQSADQDDDLELTRDAAPFFLKFGEAVLAKAPDHAALAEALAEALAAGFVRYAWAFVALEADRIEGRDLAEATRLAAAGSTTDPVVLDPKHAGLAYWGVAAWGARISLSKGEAEAVAQLPAATQRVATLQDPRSLHRMRRSVTVPRHADSQSDWRASQPMVGKAVNPDPAVGRLNPHEIANLSKGCAHVESHAFGEDAARPLGCLISLSDVPNCWT